jgi:hypothetical protein
MPETTETLDYEAAWVIAEQRTRDAQAQCDLLAEENQTLTAMLARLGGALEAVMLEWDGTLADPKLSSAYQALTAYREWRR